MFVCVKNSNIAYMKHGSTVKIVTLRNEKNVLPFVLELIPDLRLGDKSQKIRKNRRYLNSLLPLRSFNGLLIH